MDHPTRRRRGARSTGAAARTGDSLPLGDNVRGGEPPPAPERSATDLPAVMREGLVGLRHAVNVVLALVSRTLLGLRVQQLVGQALGHGLLAAVAGELDEP